MHLQVRLLVARDQQLSVLAPIQLEFAMLTVHNTPQQMDSHRLPVLLYGYERLKECIAEARIHSY